MGKIFFKMTWKKWLTIFEEQGTFGHTFKSPIIPSALQAYRLCQVKYLKLSKWLKCSENIFIHVCRCVSEYSNHQKPWSQTCKARAAKVLWTLKSALVLRSAYLSSVWCVGVLERAFLNKVKKLMRCWQTAKLFKCTWVWVYVSVNIWMSEFDTFILVKKF